MLDLVGKIRGALPLGGSNSPSPGERRSFGADAADRSGNAANDASNGGGKSLADRAVAFLRAPNPVSRRAKATVQALFRAEMPASPIYKLLANERFVRRMVLRHLYRAVYAQPILR